jgi:hypothetical protein
VATVPTVTVDPPDRVSKATARARTSSVFLENAADVDTAEVISVVLVGSVLCWVMYPGAVPSPCSFTAPVDAGISTPGLVCAAAWRITDDASAVVIPQLIVAAVTFAVPKDTAGPVAS